jgi:hypothetical protein
MQQLDETALKVLASFTAELMAAMERRSQPATPLSFPEWLAAAHGIDLDNPPFADGRHQRAE